MDDEQTDNDLSHHLGKNSCPSCGILVAAGYARCPKCKAEMPATTLAKPVAGGGTSTVGRTLSLTAVLVFAALTAMISYLAQREWPRVVGANIKAAASTHSRDGGVNNEDEAPPDNRDALLDALEAKLDTAKVPGWVDLDAKDWSTVVIRSAYCDQSLLQEAVEESMEALRENFKAVRCYARYGELAYQTSLIAAPQ